MSKVEGMIRLLRYFEAGGICSAAVLAMEYGVSLRTMNRWLAELDRWVPLATEHRVWRKA